LPSENLSTEEYNKLSFNYGKDDVSKTMVGILFSSNNVNECLRVALNNFHFMQNDFLKASRALSTDYDNWLGFEDSDFLGTATLCMAGIQHAVKEISRCIALLTRISTAVSYAGLSSDELLVMNDVMKYCDEDTRQILMEEKNAIKGQSLPISSENQIDFDSTFTASYVQNCGRLLFYPLSGTRTAVSDDLAEKTQMHYQVDLMTVS